jgi:uncharacterized membrane protein YdjX (TVP38/TMEM64 family)
MQAVNFRLVLKGLLLMASLAAIGWGLDASGLRHHLDAEWVDREIRGQGGAGWMLFIGTGALAVAVGLPRQGVCFLGGYAFGLGQGLLLGQIASILGCALCFFYARLLGRDLVRHRFADRLGRLDALLHDHPMTTTMLIRFLPVGSPNLLTNLLAGVSTVRPAPFLAGSFIGYLPWSLISALLGSGIHVQPVVRGGLSVLLFLVSAALGGFLYRRLRQGQSRWRQSNELM